MKITNKHGINIDMAKIADLASINSYWDKCSKFLHDIDSHPTLSHAMRNWLDKIENDYEDQWESKCNK